MNLTAKEMYCPNTTQEFKEEKNYMYSLINIFLFSITSKQDSVAKNFTQKARQQPGNCFNKICTQDRFITCIVWISLFFR